VSRASGGSAELIEPPFPLPIPLELRRSPRARRLSLRLDPARNRAVLTVPRSIARARAIDFLARHEGWLKARIASLPPQRPFGDDAIVPVLGVPHRIVGDATSLRGRIRREGAIITVPGAPEHLARRLTDYLKEEARREIGGRARAKAASLGCRIAALSLRDPRSRWGSCSAGGRLGFSWRLILAPEFVLDYVVAHEVAHLAEMNHGPRFWKLCAGLTGDAPAARAWLKRHGPELHRYG
jgi:predicted metal-dependent hydrolase